MYPDGDLTSSWLRQLRNQLYMADVSGHNVPECDLSPAAAPGIYAPAKVPVACSPAMPNGFFLQEVNAAMNLLTQGYAVALGVCSALSCGLAFADTITRPMNGVTRVVLKTPGELSVRYGVRESLVVEAEPKVLSALDIGIHGDTLTLDSEPFKTDQELKYTLTLRSFRSVLSQGSGNVAIENFAGGDIDVEAAGSGNMTLRNVNPVRLGMTIKGSGNIDASGSGNSVSARIEGSGRVDARDFRARSVVARIDGSGLINVHADETLKATVAGAGRIGYRGNAKVTESMTGDGRIERY